VFQAPTSVRWLDCWRRVGESLHRIYWGCSERPARALGIDSAAQVLAGVLAAEGAVAPTVVANSLGCQLVVELARSRPALVGSIVLISPTVDPHYRSWLRQSGTLLVDWAREPPALWPIIVRDYQTIEPGVVRGVNGNG
jgi:pimeloyl-ACP methyl ester carboxylesterase